MSVFIVVQECRTCGEQSFENVDDWGSPDPVVECCGEAMRFRRKIQTPGKQDKSGIVIIKEIDPVVSPIDNSVLRNRRELKNHMREHGCIPAVDKQDMPKAIEHRSNFQPALIEGAKKLGWL